MYLQMGAMCMVGRIGKHRFKDFNATKLVLSAFAKHPEAMSQALAMLKDKHLLRIMNDILPHQIHF
jgi:hypothetical protein